jgi:hypothetical protein
VVNDTDTDTDADTGGYTTLEQADELAACSTCSRGSASRTRQEHRLYADSDRSPGHR